LEQLAHTALCAYLDFGSRILDLNAVALLPGILAEEFASVSDGEDFVQVGRLLEGLLYPL
jgi:hypothetical protein